MFDTALAFRAIISLLTVILASGHLVAQDDTNKKKQGIGGILRGENNPTEVRRRNSQPTAKQPDPLVKPKQSFKERAEQLKEQIAKLNKKGYLDLDPIGSPKEAAGKIEELKKRRKSLDAKFEGQVAEATKDAVKSANQFEEKWSEITGAMTDGKSRTRDEWMSIYKKSVEQRKSAGSDSTDKPSKKDLKFDEIRKIVDQAKKPRAVPAQIWSQIQDQFFKELAALQAQVASARNRVNSQRDREMKAIDRAIADAEKHFRNLVDAKTKPSDNELRNLAWQIHRARIAQLVALYNRLMLADLEAEGLPNKIQIAIKPMSPSETLEDVARQIETSNRPGAPTRGQFDNWEGEGLPDLFPSDPDLKKLQELIDKGELYGNILKSRLDRNRRLLQDRNRELANLDPNSAADAERRKQIEEDIKWLINRNAKDSEAYEKMQPEEKPKKKTPTEKKDDSSGS